MSEIFFILGKKYLLLPAGFGLTLNIAGDDPALVPIIKIPERAMKSGLTIKMILCFYYNGEL